MNIISPEQIEPTPVELDPRPCTLCGLTVDRHEMVDDGEGPLFFCADISPDEMTLIELERRAELLLQVYVAETVASWEPMDIHRPAPPPRQPAPYRPAESTISAFRYLVASGDAGSLRSWLADRPADAPMLLAIIES
jgi:hypothetical protein